ncbi:MAG: histidinol-phosphatase [Oscillospiraceae bacterium]|nr:histidinol-phosphatase [Oscillospiraceae bacterium]
MHTHTAYCDGKNTAEEMVQAAIKKGFTTLGFSGHCYVPQEQFGMDQHTLQAYIAEVTRLKEKYKDRIDILLGIELDNTAAPISLESFDYYIADIHAVYSEKTRQYYVVDDKREILLKALQEGFDNNTQAMYHAYFAQYAAFVTSKKPLYAAHMDLICKLNGQNDIFDETASSYQKEALSCLEKLAQARLPLEVNTGGIYRGYRKAPYPAKFLLEAWRQMQGEVIIASDSHDADSIDFYFEEMQKYLKKIGYTYVLTATKQGLVRQFL